ncbi:MAG: excinuclease ABC subunit UvrA [Candidatus Omnitrophica bacterium]|nr:excinuclease ABC subunit UvrA [Candidatus Omnitrophota bacterium]
MSQEAIVLRGVRTHNLKNINLSIPHHQILVITGVSGSGKSSLAFDTLYAEGQRRYVESLSAYARQFLERMEKPDLDFVEGILPAIAIEAKNPVSNARSTVGTQTEINDYLRILFARVGKTHCSSCQRIVEIDTPDRVSAQLISQFEGHNAVITFPLAMQGESRKYAQEFIEELNKQGFLRSLVAGALQPLSISMFDVAQESVSIVADRLPLDKNKKARLVESVESAYRYGKGLLTVYVSPEPVSLLPADSVPLTNWKEMVFSNSFHCAYCKISYPTPTPHMFSFNSPLGACPECQGFGRVIDIDWNLVLPSPDRSLADGAIAPWTKPSAAWEFAQLKKFCQKKEIPWTKPFRELSQTARDLLLYGKGKEPGDEYFSVRDFFDYLEKKTYKMHIRIFLSKYRGYFLCTACQGSRLKSEALRVTIERKNIYDLSQYTLEELNGFIQKLRLSKHEMDVIGSVLVELKKRISFLNDVGLSYLTLNRLSRTLSGGEAQRINLATSLGSGLTDTLYVLDEPSIGLHERDNQLLIGLLGKLRELGNTVVVVEHDESMIRMADRIIDLGPLAGALGGNLVFEGRLPELLKNKDSLTAKYLRGDEKIKRETIPTDKKKFTVNGKETSKTIEIFGARANNLKNIRVSFPLGRFCVVTGVSGSGKSTLLYDVLYKNYLRSRGRPVSDVGLCERIEGFEQIADMALVDQSPIGRTPRSNPVTYLKAFDDIRQIFSQTPDAKRRYLQAGAFSFNVPGGRCDTCEGDGKIRVEMHFMADVFIECEKCRGMRYQPHILEVKFKGRNIHQVLGMTVDEAMEFFHEYKKLISKLSVLQKVGLGYVRLGQAASTLSAGEAQRLKLALELVDLSRENVLYIFDEPTIGLHHHDIKHLVTAFDELVWRGSSLIVIEHNLDVIRASDWILDLGPEGGNRGGEVLYSGPVQGILEEPRSYTGQFLKIKW